MKWLLARLREPSTWRGIVWLATVAGLSLRPDQAEAIVAVGMALAGLLGVFLADEPKNVNIELPPIDLQGRSESSHAALGVSTVRSSDQLRQSMPTDYKPRQVNKADSDIHSSFGSGFGDRD